MYVGTAICIVTVLVVVIKGREWVREAVAEITNAIIVPSMPIREHYKVTVKYLENKERKVNVTEMTKTNVHTVNVKEMTKTMYVKSMLINWKTTYVKSMLKKWLKQRT